MEEFSATAEPDGHGTTVVTVRGSMTIEQGQRMKDALLEALDSAGTLVLDLKKVGAVDLMGLQTICSLHRSARGKGARLEIRGGGTQVMSEVKHAAGYQRRSRCSGGADGICLLCLEETEALKEVSP